MIKIGDRNRGDSRTITSTEDAVTEKGSEKSKLVDKGTLIVSNAGTVGTARITGMKTCIHDHWLILRDYEEILNTRYLYYFINWNQDFLESLASGSTILDLNTDDFRLFDITIPNLDEQRKIADVLDCFHDERMVNEDNRRQLQRLKQGLMQDLLSGEVRTHDRNIEILDEVAQYG
jgi:type I restriction enzyme S subunit